MAKIIVHIPSNWEQEKIDSMIQEAFNMGFTNFLCSGDAAEKLSKVERVTLYTDDINTVGGIFVYDYEERGKDDLETYFNSDYPFGIRKTISSKEDEELAKSWAQRYVNFLICETTDWKIIPFENLIAHLSTLDTQLYADVGSNLDDVELLLHTLEMGVDGVVFTPTEENDLIDLRKILKVTNELTIQAAEIVEIKNIPEADRVCVDTSSMLRPGEGMLVGNTAKGFALVHAEVFESEFVASRPFRVNAGDVSEYILVPEQKQDGTIGTRTRYLSELESGDQVLVVDVNGKTRIASLGRVKIETRPMLLFKLVAEIAEGEITILATIQNAETVRLVSERGEAVSGTELKSGDKVLVHIGPGATHFGTTIKETIIEK